MNMMEKKTKVTFVIPGRGTYPVGGFKVVYEYANRLSDLGLDITVVHTAWLYKSHSFVIGIGRYIYCLLFYKFYKKWFTLKPAVKNKWVLVPIEFFIPNADFIIATSWETAENVVEYSSKKGKKIYLIQGNESQFILATKKGWQQRVLNTWSFPMQKIVISSWLQQEVEETGNTAVKIFNGLDFNEFYIQNPIENRNSPIVIMLYHNSPAKGCEEGLLALKILKKNVLDLKVIMFGVPDKPKGLEDWMEYHKMPSRENLNKLYNRSTIFLSPSHSEGWGLPAAEAMQCGCAVAVTNIGGFKDFVKNNDTGLCFDVHNVNDIVEKLSTLISNNELRIQIAKKGNLFIKQFNWEKSVDKMCDFLKTIEL
jgi:glycosyltransferase involved in cell wall biosynthesis